MPPPPPLTFGGSTAAADAAADGDGAADTFYEWATTYAGVRAIACAPAEVAEGWRGVCATAAIAPNDCILRVPGDILMSHRSAVQDPALKAVLMTAAGLELTPAERLGVHLLHEASKGSASRWHLYIAQLPRTYNLLASWSARERSMLQAPFAVDAAERSTAKVKDAWKTRALPCLRALGIPRGFCSLGAWRWAHASISSRTVFVPFDAAGALCPVGDLFNYAPPQAPHAPRVVGTPLDSGSGGVVVEGDGASDGGGGGPGAGVDGQRNDGGDGASAGDSGNGAWDEDAGEYRFYARRAYHPGDQIMLCYGREGGGGQAQLPHTLYVTYSLKRTLLLVHSCECSHYARDDNRIHSHSCSRA
jgi:hypothetical protein